MELFSQGYSLWNPCRDCRILHADPEPNNSYTQRYRGVYLHLPLCLMNDVEHRSPAYEPILNRGEFSEGSEARVATTAVKIHEQQNSSSRW